MTDSKPSFDKRPEYHVEADKELQQNCPIVRIQDIRRAETFHDDFFFEEEGSCPLLSTLESVIDFDSENLVYKLDTQRKSKEGIGLTGDAADKTENPQKVALKIANEIEFYVFVEQRCESGEPGEVTRQEGSYVWMETLSEFVQGIV